MSAGNPGRLGNQMSEYASLYANAKFYQVSFKVLSRDY